MRCYCCDSLPTRLFHGEYMCEECRSVVMSTIKEDNDNNEKTMVGGDFWIVHSCYDDDNRDRPPVTLPKMKEKKDE